ncbi:MULTISPECIES: RNase P modulator RnpM [unclassified Granulicatella]|uniref:RNase P modulator RnpM n=1 Tax=unclassified Granulicatella TaxID=2630493 RepID=UPI0010731B19|nr:MULTISPECIES: YlxR family protein [unclassified Granulicatella]MBF0781084.1 YlxR family protein [Granulicatella sp. 19428wC4_WM01]TFU92144.1 YlxR family protein [Granulicatella sp. WM01]
MKPRKIPMRKCVVSQQLYPKKELTRIVRQGDGTVAIDPSGRLNGRGAYISLNPELALKAKKSKVFERQLEVSIPDSFYDELFAYLEHKKARSLLGL